jgi:hypothetical protein
VQFLARVYFALDKIWLTPLFVVIHGADLRSLGPGFVKLDAVNVGGVQPLTSDKFVQTVAAVANDGDTDGKFEETLPTSFLQKVSYKRRLDSLNFARNTHLACLRTPISLSPGYFKNIKFDFSEMQDGQQLKISTMRSIELNITM